MSREVRPVHAPREFRDVIPGGRNGGAEPGTFKYNPAVANWPPGARVYLSAELRWFWKDVLPLGLEDSLRNTGVELDSEERLPCSAGWLLERGCQLELVSLRVDGCLDRWWPPRFEASGELDDIEERLTRKAQYSKQSVRQFGPGIELSYLAWLSAFPL